MGAQRAVAAYDDGLSKRFRLIGVPYANQYFTLSAEKLEKLRPCLVPLIKQHWAEVSLESNDTEHCTPGRYQYVNAIKDAKAQCVIIGAIYKDMKLRPSPLEEYSEQVKLSEQVAKYTSDDDRLFIEDQSIRMALHGPLLDPQKLVTGLVMAMKGAINDQGEFECEDYLMPGPPTSVPLPPTTEEKYVALVSGLNIAGPRSGHDSLLMLRDFVAGNTPMGDLSSKIVRLVIAGNGIGQCDVASLAQCDVYFAQLAAALPVDLMPGDADPSNRNLPQQPIHPCFLEHSRRYGTFQSTTNPYFFTVDGVRFLGTSGQAVKGICDYSTLSELEALQLTASARFIAPTAPDTLACHPEARVFTLEDDSEFPHVIFSGNAQEFASAETGAAGCSPRVICVPAFTKQPSVVLVSLATLQPRLIRLA